MSVLLQNRTISMIVMVPDIKCSAQSLSSASLVLDEVNRSHINRSLNIGPHSSIPIYRGSIIRVEQHNDDRNISDLIIRVPNFQSLSLSSTTCADNKQHSRIKRRAPICPILSTSNKLNNLDSSDVNNKNNNSVNKLNLSQTPVTSRSRLTTGLRSLSRAFIYSCKSKRSSSIREINILPALPDIEIMTEKVEIPTTMKRDIKHEDSISSTPKLGPPKVLFIKQKYFKIKKEQPLTSSAAMNTQASHKNNQTSTVITTHYSDNKNSSSFKETSFMQPFIETNNLTQEINTIEQDVDQEQQKKSMELNFEVDQQWAAITQLVSDIPMSSIDADSLSTHRYSTISAVVPDKQNSLIDDNDIGELSLSEQLSSIFFPTATGISYDGDKKIKSSIINKTSPKSRQQFRIQTSIFQPDISVIRLGTFDLTTEINRLLPEENLFNKEIEHDDLDDNHIKQNPGTMINSDEETFTECYEVTYQIDSQYQNKTEQKRNQIVIPIQLNVDSLQDTSITSTVTKCLPIISQNEYEQIEHTNSICRNEEEYQQIETTKHDFENVEICPTVPQISINNIRKIKFQSVDDLSRTSHDQTSTFQSESIYASSSSETSSRHCSLQRSHSYNGLGIYVSTDTSTHREHFIHQVEDLSPGEDAGLKQNDRILYINGTPVIDEDYTVVLQLIQHGLQTDTLNFDVISNDAYEEFRSHIDRIYQ